VLVNATFPALSQCQSEYLSWLVIAVTISESTKAYKSLKNQIYNNISGKDLQNINVFRLLILQCSVGIASI